MIGVENFHRVNPNLYRGAQPDDAGLKSLAKMGIKTVINFRLLGELTVREEAIVRAAGMNYIGLPMPNIDPPSYERMEEILDVMRRAEGPVFLHCRRGADRTGIVVACHRIKNEGWSNEAALNEAKRLGMYRFLFGMKRFVLAYQHAQEVFESAAPASR